MVEPYILTPVPSPATKSVTEWCADAQALDRAGKVAEAEALLVQIIAAAPAYHPALHHAAILSHKLGRPLEAIRRLQQVLQLAPDLALAHRNLGELHRTQSRLDEAVLHGRRAVELAPNDPVAFYNLGVIQYDRLEIDAAIASFRRSLALDPANASTHFKLSTALLVAGQFAEGWQEHEHRYGVPNVPPPLPPTDKPQWDGGPLRDGTLLLIGDQGFGDTIQFSRYIPAVLDRCPNLLVGCSVETLPIVRQLSPAATYFTRAKTMPRFDAWCPLSGLPRLFGAALGNIPAPIPYVRAEPAKVEQWRRRIDALVPKDHRRLGLAWAGRPAHGNDFNRSMSLDTLGPLAELDGVALVSVQMGPARDEIATYDGRAPLIDLGAEIRDFTDTAAIFECLDRLVTVDTAVAHLAGAMGKPISILMPYAPDWRWLLDRTDTPWYPTATLHRQDAPGQWDGAIAKLLQTVRVEL